MEASSKKSLILKFSEESTYLFVAVKLPGSLPRVIPMEVEVDLPVFIQDFETMWRELGDTVRDEFVRGATGRDS